MSYMAPSLDAVRGKKLGDGSAVALLETAARTPPPMVWRQGEPVLHAMTLSPGTAVATFHNGIFMNSPDSHAGLFVGHINQGFIILDQGDGYICSDSQVIHNGMPDDATHFYVIE